MNRRQVASPGSTVKLGSIGANKTLSNLPLVEWLPSREVLVGGLHYPVTGLRTAAGGLSLQRYVGTGKWPSQPIDESHVEAGIAALRLRSPKVVALSAHDSCDWTLGAFREAFGPAYRRVAVGEEIVL